MRVLLPYFAMIATELTAYSYGIRRLDLLIILGVMAIASVICGELIIELMRLKK